MKKRSSSGCVFRNALEIQFFGLRRSGNHGVIAWIAQQYASPIMFLNNARPFEDPFTTFMRGKIPNALPKGTPSQENIEQLRAAPKELLLIGYEDVRLSRLRRMDVLPMRDRWLGGSAKTTKVLLMRDFYNWIASRIKLLEKRAVPPGGLVQRVVPQIRLWQSYAREFLGETCFLGEGGVVRLNFVEWARNEAYRASVLQALDVPVTDNSRRTVPRTGGGSSFDGVQFSGAAESMSVMDRWECLREDKYADIVVILKDSKGEIDPYNNRIFAVGNPLEP